MRPGDAIAVAALAALAVALALSPALPAPPPGADPNGPMARWYRGLQIPGTGVSCCDAADCRQTIARQAGQGWEAQTPDGVWVPIPAARVLPDDAHPGGAAVMCWTPLTGVLCFVPPQAGG